MKYNIDIMISNIRYQPYKEIQSDETYKWQLQEIDMNAELIFTILELHDIEEIIFCFSPIMNKEKYDSFTIYLAQ